jgi:hypothetical protein
MFWGTKNTIVIPMKYAEKYLGSKLRAAGSLSAQFGRSYPKAFGLIAMFPATVTVMIKREKKIVKRAVRLSRLRRPRLCFNRRREIGNNDMTASQTMENLSDYLQSKPAEKSVNPADI